MRRRECITLAGAAATWPLAAHAQQAGRVRRIGELAFAAGNQEGQARAAAFRDALEQLGWTEGTASLQRFAKELVALQPDLILSYSTPITAALLQQTRSIPIVFANISDPIGSGFVANLARPGGNVTGFINMEPTMSGKWLELLKEIAPGISRVAMLFNPTTATYAESWLNPFKSAAKSLAVEEILAPVRDGPELKSVFATLARNRDVGLIVMPDSFVLEHTAEITTLAAQHRLPAVYPYRIFAENGGLLAYGNDRLENYRRAASYADRILKGEKPSELPVQFPVKFELIINLKTAKALGLDVPTQLQQRADEVIE
jgi:putative tryptophan/tyrosine transport system substrate-binding protein